MSNLQGICPICDVSVSMASDIEETEIIDCTDCKTQLVVEKIGNPKVVLSEAPQVEEDWGE